MSVIIFKKNNNITGIFDDKKVFKTSSFHFILDILLGKQYFKTKKQCGVAIKEDLKLLYSEEDYTFIFKDCKFEKHTMKLNYIETINIPKQKIESDFFVFYTTLTLNKPIQMLEVESLYTNKGLKD